MKIEQCWRDICALRRTVQVVCCKGQSRADRFGTVRWYSLNRKCEREDARKREDENYEEVVGYFNAGISLADFEAECIAQCEKVRAIERFAESQELADQIFRLDGTDYGDVGICPPEYLASSLDVRQEWTPHPHDRHSSEYAAGRGGDTGAPEGAEGSSDSQARGLQGRPGEDDSEPPEGRDAWYWIGYL